MELSLWVSDGRGVGRISLLGKLMKVEIGWLKDLCRRAIGKEKLNLGQRREDQISKTKLL
jgi:hypothetical protein